MVLTETPPSIVPTESEVFGVLGIGRATRSVISRERIWMAFGRP